MPQFLIFSDAAIALFILVAVVLARAKGDRQTWALFWSGFFLGLIWEVGFFLDGPLFSPDPAYQMSVDFPVHPALQPLAHSIWDGALFLVGVWFVRRFCNVPAFKRFRAAELLVLVIWGNTQEFVVEILACGAGLWTFVPGPYNLQMFSFGFGAITTLPQIIWTLAPVAYYWFALRVHQRFDPGSPGSASS